MPYSEKQIAEAPVSLALGTRVFDSLGKRWIWLKQRTPDGGVEYQYERPYIVTRPRPGGWCFGGTLTPEGIKWLRETNPDEQDLIAAVRKETREECARVAEREWQNFSDTKEAHERLSTEPFRSTDFGFDYGCVMLSKHVAAAIRNLQEREEGKT